MHQLLETNFPRDIVDWFADRADAEAVTRAHLGNAHGAHRADATFPWILGQSGLPWLPLRLDFPYEAMAEEALRLRDRFVSHRSGKEGGGYVDGNRGWAAIALHGVSAEHTMSFNMYGYKGEEEVPYRWTEIADACPVTVDFLRRTYPCGQYYRVRYTIIEPGGFIYPHTDRKNSALWEVNLALRNPEGFHFKMEGAGYIPFAPGRGFVLDVSRQHALVNLADEDRVHMIIHGNPMREPRFQRLITESYAALAADPSTLWSAAP